MLNYTTANLISATVGQGRIPAIRIGDQVFPVQAAASSVKAQVVPYVLFVSNDQSYNGNYIATSSTFNNAPVYELTQ